MRYVKVEKGQVTRAIIIKTSTSLMGNVEEVPKGKVRVRIPSIHGPTRRDKLPPEYQGFRSGYVNDADLPFASVCLPLGTKSNDVSSLFQDKEIVYIMWTSTSMDTPLVIGTTGVVVKDE